MPQTLVISTLLKGGAPRKACVYKRQKNTTFQHNKISQALFINLK